MKKIFITSILMLMAFSLSAISKKESEELLKLAQDNTGFFETDFSGNYTVVQDIPGEGKTVIDAVTEVT